MRHIFKGAFYENYGFNCDELEVAQADKSIHWRTSSAYRTTVPLKEWCLLLNECRERSSNVSGFPQGCDSTDALDCILYCLEMNNLSFSDQCLALVTP